MKTRLTEMWQEYVNLTLKDIEPDSVQYIETKKAFMAGAIGMFENVQYISMRYDEDKAMAKFKEIELEAAEWLTEFIVMTSPRRPE